MGTESPIVTIGLVILLPILLRNAGRFRLAALIPSIKRRQSPLQSPAEVFLFIVLAAICAYDAACLWPDSASHRQAIDIFRKTGLPIGASSVALRSRTSGFSLEELGLAGTFADSSPADEGEEGDLLERLFRRLSSMAGRQTYLLLGPRPILDCHYCKQNLDLQLFALPPLFLQYVMHLLCLGVLTASPSLLNSIDQGFKQMRPQALDSTTAPRERDEDPRASTVAPRAHSHGWRRPVSLVLFIGAILDLSVLGGAWGWSEDQQSWWNHWHHNAFLLRHFVFLLLPTLVYLYPVEPSRSVSSSGRIILNISETQQALGKAAASIALVDQSRDVVWQDPELRAAAQAWHERGDREGEAVSQGAAQLTQHLKNMLQGQSTATGSI